MNALHACPECGFRIPTDAPRGLCPRCLMNASSSETATHRQPKTSDAIEAGAIVVDQFDLLRALHDLDLIPAQDLERLMADAGDDPARLARVLVQAKKLTAYQAGALLQGKARGLLIGQYLVEEKLGSGGMGVVFKARHRPSQRVVALKILPPSFGRDADALRRFRREFQVASRLSHPNVIATIEANEDRGVHYLTMEYIPGHDLDKLVSRGGPMALKLALHCAIQAARGMEAAHAQGVVHRDIKPGNIMIDPAGAVRVLDLGLARVIEASSQIGQTAAGNLTQSGAFMGTVDFLAPEQANDAKSADARADIYSLGCTLFFLLTGKPPFQGDTVLKRLLAHQERPAPSLRAARPEVSDLVEDTYLKMMSKRPSDRPQSMSEVVMALEACCRVTARETGDVSADLKNFARTIMKRAPMRGRRGPDASIFAQNKAHELTFDPDLRIEDLVSGYRDELGHAALSEEKLPPIASRSLPKRVRRRRQSPPYALIALALSIVGITGAGYRYWLRTDSVTSPETTSTTASRPASGALNISAASTGRSLYVDEFDNPASGWPHESPAERQKAADEHHGYVNGVYRLDVNPGGWIWKSWPCPQRGFPEFSCTVEGRIYGDRTSKRPNGYGYLALVIDGPEHGLQIMLNTQSEITVKTTTPNAEPKLLGSRHHSAIRSGPIGFNKLVVQVRKRRVEIFVNGEPVFDPVILGWDATPANLSLGILDDTPNLHAEFDRIDVRELLPDEKSRDNPALARVSSEVGAFKFIGSRPTLVAPYRARSPIADGDIQPGEYGPEVEVDFVAGSRFGAMFPGLKNTALTKSADDLSVRLSAAYTDRALFLACRVRDQFVDQSETDRDRPHLNDSVAIFLDGDGFANDFNPRIDSNAKGSKEGFQLVADAAGHQATFAEGLTNRDWNTAARRTGDGYVIEYKIPLSCIDVEDRLGVVPAAPGALIHFGLALTDNDEDVSDQRSFSFLRAKPNGLSPFLAGESAWDFGIRLVPHQEEKGSGTFVGTVSPDHVVLAK
jgi:serine/threonine protein kinase